MRLKGLTEKLLNEAVGMADGGADVRGSTGWGMEVVFEQNKLKAITASESSILDLRVMNGGQLGAAATNKMDEIGLSDVVKEAISVSQFGQGVKFNLPGPTGKLPLLKTYDAKVAELSEIKLVEQGKRLIGEILEREPSMMVNYLGFAVNQGESYFANSLGASCREKETSNSFWVEISKIAEGDFFQIGCDKISAETNINYREVVEKALEMVVWGKHISKLRSSRMRVIFTPETARGLIGYFISATNGKLINEGVSRFTGKLGQQLFDRRLTILEDPRLDWGIASCVLDDEGVPTRLKSIIELGKIASFYYDLNQAAKAGVTSTGNGFREPYFQADPRVTNVVVSPGEEHFEKLLKSENECLIVHQVLGAGQSNPYNGDFQLGVSLGYLARSGEIVGRVKDVSIAGNIFDLFADSLMWISKEREWKGAYYLPHICLDNVSVTAK